MKTEEQNFKQGPPQLNESIFSVLSGFAGVIDRAELLLIPFISEHNCLRFTEQRRGSQMMMMMMITLYRSSLHAVKDVMNKPH